MTNPLSAESGQSSLSRSPTAALPYAERHLPSGRFVFECKARLLQIRRAISDIAGGIHRFPRGEPVEYPVVLAESRTPLWNEPDPQERWLEWGKVQNLRLALRRLNGAEVPVEAVFSFWKQIGRATRLKGYAPGRLLREGCLIPSIGGGLCQLSNALYEAALQCGLTIVERHGHSRVVPGSAAAAGRDATVAWNYIDLRFRPAFPILIEALIEADELVVRLRRQSSSSVAGTSAPHGRGEPIRLIRETTGSCSTCGEISCFQQGSTARLKERSSSAEEGRTAYLVDERWPEFEQYLARTRQPQDLLCIPLDVDRWHQRRHSWDTSGYGRVHAATWQTLRRGWTSRRLGRYGAARLAAQFRSSEILAATLSRRLTADVLRVVVAQSMLPFLWRAGHLGGRQVEVLMTRLPLTNLHSLLDGEFERHPERTTLREYRAPDWIVQAEQEALSAADRIVSAHGAIVDLFPGRALELDWKLPGFASKSTHQGPGERAGEGTKSTGRKLVAFPGPTAARKGAYIVREAARYLGLELVLLGTELEGSDFWEGLSVCRRSSRSERCLDGVAVVLQPPLVEDNPRILLGALAAGVPIIATSASGLRAQPGVQIVPYDDEHAVVAALHRVLRSEGVE